MYLQSHECKQNNDQILFYHSYTVDSVCPGDTVVFTCVTDTVFLVWRTNKLNCITHQINIFNESAVSVGGIFTVKLVSTTGQFESHNVSPDYNGVNITCSNNVNHVCIFVGEKSSILCVLFQFNTNCCRAFMHMTQLQAVSPLKPLNIQWYICTSEFTLHACTACLSKLVLKPPPPINLSITDLTSDGA